MSKSLQLLANKECVARYPHLCCISEQFLCKFSHLERLELATEKQVKQKTLDLFTKLKHLVINHSARKYTFSKLVDLEVLVVHSASFNATSLRKLSNLTSLSVPGNYNHAVKLPQITNLRVTGFVIPPEVCKAYPNLKCLNSDEPVFLPPNITKLTELTSFNLDRGANRNLFEEIAKSHPNVERLHLFQGVDLNRITKLSNLRTLSVGESLNFSALVNLTQLTDLNCNNSSLPGDIISKLKNLRCLRNPGSGICFEHIPASVRKLCSEYTSMLTVSQFTRLTSLDARCKEVTGLSKLKNLTELKLEIADLSLADLGSLTGLKSLKIYMTSEAPHDIEFLAFLTSIEKLVCPNFAVSDEIVSSLPKLTKLRRLKEEGDWVIPGVEEVYERTEDYESEVETSENEEEEERAEESEEIEEMPEEKEENDPGADVISEEKDGSEDEGESEAVAEVEHSKASDVESDAEDDEDMPEGESEEGMDIGGTACSKGLEEESDGDSREEWHSIENQYEEVIDTKSEDSGEREEDSEEKESEEGERKNNAGSSDTGSQESGEDMKERELEVESLEEEDEEGGVKSEESQEESEENEAMSEEADSHVEGKKKPEEDGREQEDDELTAFLVSLNAGSYKKVESIEEEDDISHSKSEEADSHEKEPEKESEEAEAEGNGKEEEERSGDKESEEDEAESKDSSEGGESDSGDSGENEQESDDSDSKEEVNERSRDFGETEEESRNAERSDESEDQGESEEKESEEDDSENASEPADHEERSVNEGESEEAEDSLDGDV